MFINESPKFDKGRILKKEMLENLKSFPRDFIDVYFKDYSNGIICGANLVINKMEIIVKSGIIKYENKIYIMVEDHKLSYESTNRVCLIKLKFLIEKDEKDFNVSNTRIFLDYNTSVEEDEIELGRFKLREGAQLRSDYVDFYDFDTEFNTVNIINVNYAAMHKPTMSPLVINYFINIIRKCHSKNIYDVSFATSFMNSRFTDRESLIYYISDRLDMDYKELTNVQIYKYLCSIVKELQSGVVRRPEVKQNRPSRIIVD